MLFELSSFEFVCACVFGLPCCGATDCAARLPPAPPGARRSKSTDAPALAICMSGGYEDDDDHGDWFFYTGQGGRNGSTGAQVGAGRGVPGGRGARRGRLQAGLTKRPACNLWPGLSHSACRTRFIFFLPQVSDQKWDMGNAALRVAQQRGTPVRVMRKVDPKQSDYT